MPVVPPAPVAPGAPSACGRPTEAAAGGARPRGAGRPAIGPSRRSHCQAARPSTPALSGGTAALGHGAGCRGRGAACGAARGVAHGAARGAACGAARGAARGATRGAGHGACRGAARGAARRGAAPMAFQSYGDPRQRKSPSPIQTLPSCRCSFWSSSPQEHYDHSCRVFSPFFTPEMVSNICEHTNSYANEHIISGSHQSYMQSDGSWKDTTPEEINRLIALMIYFGLVKVGVNIDRYWSTKTLYYGLWARSIMTRTRFRALMALLHVVDPATEDPGDKLRKVESFIDYFKSTCLALYQPRQQMAIEEHMVKSRHRSGIRQYIKDKPTKWGIKLRVLADTSNGYTVDFNVYIGKAAGTDVSEHGLGYDVVVTLMQNFFNQGYHLYIDNFYTSTVLVKYLLQQGVPTTGE